MVGLKLTLNLERDHDDANQIHLDPSNDANQMMSITFQQLLMKIFALSGFCKLQG